MKFILFATLALTAFTGYVKAPPVNKGPTSADYIVRFFDRAQLVIWWAEEETQFHKEAGRIGVASMLIYLVGQIKHLEAEFHIVKLNLEEDSESLFIYEDRLVGLAKQVREELVKLEKYHQVGEEQNKNEVISKTIDQAIIARLLKVAEKARAEIIFHQLAERQPQTNMLSYLLGELMHMEKEFLIMKHLPIPSQTLQNYEERLLGLTNKVDEEVTKLAHYRLQEEDVKEVKNEGEEQIEKVENEIIEQEVEKEEEKVEEVIEGNHKNTEDKLRKIIDSLKGNLNEAINELELKKEHEQVESEV